MDKTTTIEELKQRVRVFCEERDWDPFHNPKDLAIGISTEAGELLDLFRFKTAEQMKEMFLEDTSLGHIEDELADIMFFVVRFAQMYGLDLDKCLQKKMKQNGEKYPVEKSRGKNLKYTQL